MEMPEKLLDIFIDDGTVVEKEGRKLIRSMHLTKQLDSSQVLSAVAGRVSADPLGSGKMMKI